MALTRTRLPPKRLRRRVGWEVFPRLSPDAVDDPGLEQWRYFKSLLPGDGSAAGRQILDFGCGVGRVLIPAVRDAPEAEFWGCDVHAPSIEWLRPRVPQRVHVLHTAESPPSELPGAHFDLVYAYSVFTHLMDSWSAWLVELHRVLRDDGLLIATVFGPGHSAFGREPISEESIGMNVLNPSASWDIGGPLVAHSEWWLRAHWGRAFEIVDLHAGDPAGPPPLFGQSGVVMRKRPGRFTVEDLERPEPGEPREFAALRQNVMSLRREIARDSVYLTQLAAHRSAAGDRAGGPQVDAAGCGPGPRVGGARAPSASGVFAP
jgi:SAM-dependent methyltransferase